MGMLHSWTRAGGFLALSLREKETKKPSSSPGPEGALISDVLMTIWIGRIAHPIAEEIEGEHGNDYRQGGKHQPGRDSHGLHILRLL
jgi:hypothetical protein